MSIRNVRYEFAEASYPHPLLAGNFLIGCILNKIKSKNQI